MFLRIMLSVHALEFGDADLARNQLLVVLGNLRIKLFLFESNSLIEQAQLCRLRTQWSD